MIEFWSELDERCMDRALELAQKGEFYVSPNPLVGCVISNPEGTIVGSGWHKAYGGPHAEVHAFESLELKDPVHLNQCTWYITLEPCNHQGKTPPCTDLIIRCKPKRVVVGTMDPNPIVAGKGIKRLRLAGITVDVGCRSEQSIWLNRRFIFAMKYQRPWVVLKWAQTQDGFLDPRPSKERTPKSGGAPITGKKAQVVTHFWRALEMGILIGAQTALIDKPQLTVRRAKGRNPMRFVLDPDQIVPENHPLFQIKKSENKAIHIISSKVQFNQQDHICIWDPSEGLSVLLNRLYTTYGINSLLIEGGAFTLSRFITEDLWNEIKRWENPMEVRQGLRAPEIPRSAVPVPFGHFQGQEQDDHWKHWIHQNAMEILTPFL